MADNENPTQAPAKVSAGENATLGDHDRVQMLSLNADGTPNQLRPELIGDAEATLAATKEQFRQQAVSAVDTQLRRPEVPGVADAPQDPYVEELQKQHSAAESAAEAAAEQAVKSLSS